jgi:hypothetical protein
LTSFKKSCINDLKGVFNVYELIEQDGWRSLAVAFVRVGRCFRGLESKW